MAITSLTSSKTPGIIVAEIQMMSTSFKGVHFLVEGDDDSKFWKLRVSPNTVTIVNCEGKPNLLGASTLIQRAGINSVIGIYDPDFERLYGVTHHSHFLATTDHNDLELTMVASKALDVLLHEYGDSIQIIDFEKTHNTNIASYLEKVSRQFGQLRFLSTTLGHQVDFDRLSPYRFLCQETWVLDRQSLLSEYANLAGIAITEIDPLIEQHCPAVQSWLLSQGHDTMKALAQGLRRRIGRKQMNEHDVARILRIAFSAELLQQSAMYQTLHSFESRLSAAIFNFD